MLFASLIVCDLVSQAVLLQHKADSIRVCAELVMQKRRPHGGDDARPGKNRTYDQGIMRIESDSLRRFAEPVPRRNRTLTVPPIEKTPKTFPASIYRSNIGIWRSPGRGCTRFGVGGRIYTFEPFSRTAEHGRPGGGPGRYLHPAHQRRDSSSYGYRSGRVGKTLPAQAVAREVSPRCPLATGQPPTGLQCCSTKPRTRGVFVRYPQIPSGTSTPLPWRERQRGRKQASVS